MFAVNPKKMLSVKRKKIFLKVLFFLSSLIFIFIVCEIISRNLEKQQCVIDTRVYLQQAHISLHRVSEIPGLCYELIPNIVDQYGFCSINSKGIRDKEYAIPKPNNVFRIIILGDSVTFGPEYLVEQTYPKVLEQLLNQKPDGKIKFEVLNAGVCAYNAIQKFIFLKYKLLDYQPDLVLFQFINDDYYRNAVVMPNVKNKIKGHACLSMGEYFALNFPPIFSFNEGLNRFLLKHSAFYRIINTRLYDALSKRYPQKYMPNAYKFAGYKELADSMKANKNVFGEIAKLSERYKFKFVLLLVPTLKNEDDMDPWIRNECPRLFNFEVIDLFKIFKEKNIDLIPLRSEPNGICHFNKQGHAIVANIIYNWLKMNMKN